MTAAVRRSRITPHDIRILAFTLVDRHGPKALGYADQAVTELEDKGEAKSAQAWKALRWEIEDVLDGRVAREAVIALH